MFHALHWLIVALYIAAPLAAILIAFARTRADDLRPMGRLFFTIFVGTLLGTTGAVVYALSLGARAGIGQIFLTIYFATAVLLSLRGFDFLIRRTLRPIFLSNHNETSQHHFGFILLNLVRLILLIAVGLPYIISAAVVYRPSVWRNRNAMNQARFVPIEFKSSDGLALRGRWIPASSPNRNTLLICHGAGLGWSNQLSLAARLAPEGYNLMVFDFRADGQSDGHFTSFGDLERRDVLAAVQWLDQTHPRESRRIVGIGFSTGAAALIAAAADPSPQGQSIQAVVACGTYDDLTLLARDIAHRSFLPPMDWLAPRIGLPLASLQVGANLNDFKPAQLVRQIWPRPILIVHAMHDRFIPFECGERLFDAAVFPKAHLWLGGDSYNQAIDEDAADTIREFFETARSIPVI